ncbi:MAG: carbamoyl phosphate synthase small subunit, partial [Spirochaetales bacterium]
EVGSRKVVELNPLGAPHVALLDCGIKANIVRQLLAHECRVTIVPSDFEAAQLEAVGADALFVSNGPGDPGVLSHQIGLIKASIGKRPVLGICLGHQLIAEAVGAKTYKMKFGHHGVNHPVRDERTKRVFVTSQNHGFAVDEKSLPDGCEVWFRNANDGSIEGIVMDDKRIRTTQFHPESAPGPHDSHWIFRSFLDVVGE